jgi:hypothetical protein
MSLASFSRIRIAHEQYPARWALATMGGTMCLAAVFAYLLMKVDMHS